MFLNSKKKLVKLTIINFEKSLIIIVSDKSNINHIKQDKTGKSVLKIKDAQISDLRNKIEYGNIILTNKSIFPAWYVTLDGNFRTNKIKTGV